MSTRSTRSRPWGLDSRAAFRTIGEQIDGSFQHDGTTYLLEAKSIVHRPSASFERSRSITLTAHDLCPPIERKLPRLSIVCGVLVLMA
ncbi:hypothetical protein CN074_19445 [Sinorhizobium medicae]|nr:hypothetical protein CN201_22625 [Sinorhizobium medicae]RVI98196.1 hypothetical protein CN183_31520 [Sinorhizobium medicae]RVP66191.1 hypothetical protein CN074_19445 [Sinorhizobium medicae]RVQ77315.1 hypothetical protein CN244_04630 [Sinorhizobium medicae]